MFYLCSQDKFTLGTQRPDPYLSLMYPHQVSDPSAISAADFEIMAQRAYDALPEVFRLNASDITIFISDFAEQEVLDHFGMSDSYQLSGLYQGIDMGQKSISWAQPFPDRIFLYRLPILAEWVQRGDERLDHLIQHVLIHEIGHHFGLSDEDMHRIENRAEN